MRTLAFLARFLSRKLTKILFGFMAMSSTRATSAGLISGSNNFRKALPS